MSRRRRGRTITPRTIAPRIRTPRIRGKRSGYNGRAFRLCCQVIQAMLWLDREFVSGHMSLTPITKHVLALDPAFVFGDTHGPGVRSHVYRQGLANAAREIRRAQRGGS